MRQWEQATWATGQTESEVIRRVGEIVARRALAMTRAGDQILILAGKGHNGDDARLAEPHLRDRKVALLNVVDPASSLTEFVPLAERRSKLIIDGLFGIGLNRALDAKWVRFIEQINETRIPILAVDLASGLNADTGEPFGAALKASVTLTLGAIKAGLLSPAAWPFVGRLEVAPEIGLVPCPFDTELNWTLAEDFFYYPPPRLVVAHKGTFGHLAIIAGSLGYHGAAVLASRGAQRARPGLVTLCVLENVYDPVASQLQAVMVRPYLREPDLPDSSTAILCGPGLASDDLPASLKSSIVTLWQKSTLPMIVDASALDWLPNGPTTTDALRVLTPHPGEVARLLQTSSAKVQADRPAAVRELSRCFGNCWVVLKGHQTLIGRSEGKIFVNSSGNPFLAQGGSGDVLAGFIGGLLAQPELQSDAEKVLRYAVWQHGAAADQLQETRANWTVENLVESLGSFGR
jgi:NAD(P)H-hydrate epimerase